MSLSPPAPHRSPGHRLARTFKDFVFWSPARGSWQYDVVVALILLFVFLTPARFFHDQPVYNPSLIGDVARLSQDSHGTSYRVSAALLASYDDDPRRAAQAVLTLNLDHPFELTRIEPVRAQDGVIVWYDVWVREER
ncbi:MAG: hypothetical protein ACE1Z1_01990 [Candidatus Acidiferrales bacterium]